MNSTSLFSSVQQTTADKCVSTIAHKACQYMRNDVCQYVCMFYILNINTQIYLYIHTPNE